MPKIEKGKPLPEHTKLDYYECYAKIILETLFSDRYETLSLADKPDLQNLKKDIGIEVTTAVDSKRREAEKLWYTMPYVKPEKQKKNIERMRQLGVEYTRGFQVWNAVTISGTEIDGYPIEEFIFAYQNKLQKLNEGKYKSFSCYDLFVYSELYVPQSLIDIVLKRLLSYNISDKKFSWVILHAQENIIVFDLLGKTHKTFDFSDKQRSFAIQARELVEKGEDNDET